jgi:hypothetical protein
MDESGVSLSAVNDIPVTFSIVLDRGFEGVAGSDAIGLEPNLQIWLQLTLSNYLRQPFN